jgi:glycosyl transferase family 25
MKIVVISLPNDDERRNQIEKQLSDHGLEFQFFDAVASGEGIPAEYEHLIDRRGLDKFWRVLSNSEIGCALSHALACDHIHSELKEPAIILEDDAILNPDFGDLVRSGSLEASKFDLILLYHNNTRAVKWPKQNLFSGYTLRTPIKAPWGAVAYYVSSAGAGEIARRALPIASYADWPFDILEMKTSCIVPRIVEHPEVTIEQTTMKDRGVKKHFEIRRKRGVFEKLRDPKYRKYLVRKIRSEWIYKP